MSYNVGRNVNPQACICSFSSEGAGSVLFTFIHGDFTPSILDDVITFESGFEYFVTSSPTITVATTYYHIVDGVNGTSYSVGAASNNTGLDEQSSSMQADAPVTFSINVSQAVTDNSRLVIWRFPL